MTETDSLSFHVNVKQIIRLVCETYCVDEHEMLSNRRSQEIVVPRQVAMWLARRLTDYSLPRLGRIFGDRDHSTVKHACMVIDFKRDEDTKLAARLDSLLHLLSKTKQDGREATALDLADASYEAVETGITQLRSQLYRSAIFDPAAFLADIDRIAERGRRAGL